LIGSASCSSGGPERAVATTATAGSPTAIATAETAATPAASANGYEIVAVYPHDTAAYTQGLFWHEGYLYEGTGRAGTSWLRKVDPQTGEVAQQVALPSEYFGEGVALLGDNIYQLTWLSKRGFIYDAASFERVGEFRYNTEGWGLTTDGTRLIMSDGSANLFFLDPRSQEVVRTVRVHEDGDGIDDLNELEYIGGLVYANVWHSDIVFKVDPETGAVVGRIDFSDLLVGERPPNSEAVLNGIAYNPNNGHLYVTGKLWPKLLEIRLIPGDPGAR
jgi:glutamine cyclotransferase